MRPDITNTFIPPNGHDFSYFGEGDIVLAIAETLEKNAMWGGARRKKNEHCTKMPRSCFGICILTFLG